MRGRPRVRSHLLGQANSEAIEKFLLFLPLVAEGEFLLNQVQAIGIHNSYHVAPSAEGMERLGLFSKRATEAWDYSRELLDKQLEAGLWHFESDGFADPDRAEGQSGCSARSESSSVRSKADGRSFEKLSFEKQSGYQ